MFKPKLGWMPDVPDQRDYIYKAPRPLLKKRPSRVDLRAYMPPIYDQGDLGSCVAQAVGSTLQYLQKKQKRKWFVPSRLFIYYNSRLIDGTISMDCGTYIRSGIKAVNKYGGPEEILWPYVILKFATQPESNVYTEGQEHQLLRYERVSQKIDIIESRLSQGFPIVLGIAIYDSFIDARANRSGYIRMPKRKEKLLGGHAIVLVGYNRAKKRFICRNSWGSQWGLKGNFTIPYKYILNRDLADDLWTVQLVE
jgi:C1A family cysteine protease